MTGTNSDRILVNPQLLADPDIRNELLLGWTLHTALAAHVLARAGIREDGQLGTLLLSMAADAFAYLCFAASGADAPFGPPPPSGEHDAHGVGANAGAALAGSSHAKAQLNHFVDRFGSDGMLAQVVVGLLAADESWTQPQEPIDSARETWDAAAARRHGDG
jgi:hypothetical protein